MIGPITMSWPGWLELLDSFEDSYDWSQMVHRPDPFEPTVDRLLARLPPADGTPPHAPVTALATRIRKLPAAGVAWLEEELHNLGANPLVRERLAIQLPALIEPRLAVEGARIAADVNALTESVPEWDRLTQRRMLAALAFLVGSVADSTYVRLMTSRSIAIVASRTMS